MYTKAVYVVIDCLAIIDLIIVLTALRRVSEKYSKWLRLTLIAGIVAIIANILIAISPSAFSAEISYCLYFASIDWILLFLWGFCLSYTEHFIALRRLTIPAGILMLVDTVSILLNPIFGHHFTIYETRNQFGIVFFQTSARSPYYFHLALDYVTIAIALSFILFRIFKSYSLYRLKYLMILLVLLFVLFLNVLYMAFHLALDASVVFYAVAGTLIYFSTEIFVPRGLMNASIGRAVDDMNEGLILFDISNRCIYANAFSKKHFEIHPEIYDFSCEPVAETIAKLNEKGLSYGEHDFCRALPGEDRPQHFHIRYNPLTDKKNRTIGSYFLIEDTTEAFYYMEEINAAKNEADSANQAKSQFLASMSHEIRTPLNSILGMNELILRNTDHPELTEYAENIRISGERLLNLINDILDFSKIEARKMNVIQAEYNPHQLLRDCNRFFEQTAHEKDLYFRITCESTMPSRLFGDEQHLRQILSNLVSNAIKYTTEGGITLDMSTEDTSEDTVNLILSVFDTGIGISEEDANYLFNPFQRVNEVKNATIQGTGLGLSIARELLSLMNGSITVQSEVGKGSRFKIIVPQKIADPSPIGTFSVHEEKKQSQPHREKFHAREAVILAVDDVSVNLKVILGLLKKTQIQIDTAQSGDEAIEKCRERKYDLILLDHRMPEKDGIETFREISAGGVNADTPVVMLTANALSGAAEEYQKIGFASYLSKPVTGDELEETLLRLLPLEKVEREL